MMKELVERIADIESLAVHDGRGVYSLVHFSAQPEPDLGTSLTDDHCHMITDARLAAPKRIPNKVGNVEPKRGRMLSRYLSLPRGLARAFNGAWFCDSSKRPGPLIAQHRFTFRKFRPKPC